MVATELEVVFRTEKAGVRVRCQAPPPYTYAVTVEVEQEQDRWRTVRLWDNADGVDEHHVHEYIREEGKQKPIIRNFKSINEGMAAAIAEARRNAVEIVRQWEEA